MSYITELNTPLSWVRDKFRFTVGLKNTAPPLFEPDINESVSNLVYQSFPSIYNSDDWNTLSLSQIESSNILFGAANKLEQHFFSISEILSGRINENNAKITGIENKLKTTNTYLSDAGLTQYTISSSNSYLIDTTKKLYPVYPLLNWSNEEESFKLEDTGSFSSIRTAGGTFATTEILDSNYPIAKTTGKLKNIIDGSNLSIWQVECHSETPIYSNRNTIPWVVNTTNGAAIALDFYYEKPLLISEIVINPSTVKPMILDSVRWKPSGLINAISDPTVASSGWTLSGDAEFTDTLGVSGSRGIALSYSYDTRGKEVFSKASQTFSCSGAYNTSASAVLTYPGSSYLVDDRYDFSFKLYGTGITVAVKVIWLNSSNEPIKVDQNEYFTGGYYRQAGFTLYKPEGAVSGTIQFTTETATFAGSGFIDDISLTVGEKVWAANKQISKTTFVNLPLRATTSRMTLVFAQENPITVVLPTSEEQINPVALSEINPALVALFDPAPVRPSKQIFNYIFGFKEIDFRYREYIPRGAIISKPVDTRKEIRRLWMSVEEANNSLNGLSFFIYPFADDLSKRITCEPFVIQSNDSLKSVSYNGSGSVYEIYTNEEYNEGLYNTDSNINKFLIDPVQQLETYSGTSREGVLQLNKPLHFRRVNYNRVSNWLRDNSVDSYVFDPNSAIVYGITGSAKETLQAYTFNDSGITINASSLVYTNGYIPLEVELHTSRFSAYPDKVGAPTNSLILPVSGEVLELANAEQQERTVEEQVIGFDDWYATSTPANTRDKDNTGVVGNIFYNLDAFLTMSFKQYDEQVLTKEQDRTNFKSKMLHVYEKLKANNILPKTQNTVNATIIATKSLNVFKTKFSPIVAGKSGSHINVYIRNIETLATTGIVKSDYTLNPNTGTVTLNSNKTIDLSEVEVVADYLHFVNPYTKDTEKYNSAIFDKPAETDGYITRNMTDYKNGSIPKLRPFQPDSTRLDYYPVIEYYVTANSELVFSRDFFEFGDLPATIHVKYETLNIQPRFSAWVLRTSDVRSPNIRSLSLGFRSASPSLERPL